MSFGAGPFGLLPFGGLIPLWGTATVELDAQLVVPNPRLAVLNSQTTIMVITVELTPRASPDRVVVA